MPGEPRFYFDVHVPKSVLRALRRRNIDVVAGYEIGLNEASDTEHLVQAAAEGRVLVSVDFHFGVLGYELEHAGILKLPPQSPIGLIVEAVLICHGAMSAEELRNTVHYI